ncbi:serpin peptidase inhibitor%2C clade F (alpha-2 antiplasmin, pigment epithelium derived factor), member 2b [Xyrichtys novacula]|uniref:Serpin peptidase inhibitor, clade F (Alpha-2 antiplasmin, pigment epithelium derived factor), member 2b n=1 Tax=Xyrichtys novacula TaxID=13765 RepID=A0AAV1FVI7_XYRNO|nr:serpin peptidase inhibitor%2C clade F (alpha-2 antiplasmin, pigment epithelium derived factor), member 2b [Xyrichtys novacula]
MDLRLTLLLICLCSQGVIKAEVADNESIPLVPLIPLMPSQPIEQLESETTPQPITVSTTEDPLFAISLNGGSSAEEDDKGCLSISRRSQSREAVAAAIQKLGVQLLQNLETTPEQPNIIISPFSIALALSQLALGEWKARFDPRFTSRGVFYLDSKSMVDVEVMEDAKHPLSLFIDNELDAQVASFPFQKSMSLLVVMPMSGQMNISALTAKLNITDLYNRLPKQRAVQVKVPKFKLEYGQELQDVFTKLGLGEMFSSPNLADMADGPLLVSSVMHKSSMEINEEGAEAAAATTVVISRASNPVFHLTQPFFFALMDEKTQVPIFMGVINNPNPGAPVLERGDPGNKDKVGFPIDKNHVGTFGGPPK